MTEREMAEAALTGISILEEALEDIERAKGLECPAAVKEARIRDAEELALIVGDDSLSETIVGFQSVATDDVLIERLERVLTLFWSIPRPYLNSVVKPHV